MESNETLTIPCVHFAHFCPRPQVARQVSRRVMAIVLAIGSSLKNETCGIAIGTGARATAVIC